MIAFIKKKHQVVYSFLFIFLKTLTGQNIFNKHNKNNIFKQQQFSQHQNLKQIAKSKYI